MRARAVTEVPLLRFLDTSLERVGGQFSLTLPWSRNALNAADVLHGGAISTVLDLAAYLAILPHLQDREEAVTHAFCASYLRAARASPPLTAQGRVLRLSRRLAFLQSELRQEETVLAVATVTKSIVPRAPSREGNE